ncbi:hypothetical protein [Fictibacillus phosphorivorans]|uniref:hypothetical protein n=1 Tax=Fictibacillus phosphorivorans TaxID=1221500 RepID=UPI00203D10E9|nr:hypothetical protein [Fictibacillus phosphorivorans]MCM3717823.1 hypothetical protein [Fictibacillus phosphorivorans]MCM3777051.1 hypothetical protein [Fictibacillus phosphorivorans]
MDEQQLPSIENALLLLDFMVILLVDKDPVTGVVLLGLLKTVTEDRLIRVAFILLVILLSVGGGI